MEEKNEKKKKKKKKEKEKKKRKRKKRKDNDKESDIPCPPNEMSLECTSRDHEGRDATEKERQPNHLNNIQHLDPGMTSDDRGRPPQSR